MKHIVTGIIEAIYVIYMLRFFKTKTNFGAYSHNFLEEIFSKEYVRHPMQSDLDKRQSVICDFGKDISIAFGIFLILKGIIYEYNFNKNSILKLIHITVLLTGIILSFANLNALIYMTPIFIIEILYITGKINT